MAIPPVSREGGRTGLPKKGKWSPRGTGTTVLACPRPTASRYWWQQGVCARVPGKAGENGQISGDGAARAPWTRPSAPATGDTSKASASTGGDQEFLLPGGTRKSSFQGLYRLGHRPVVLSQRRGDGSVYSQACVRTRCIGLSTALPSAATSVIVGTEKVFARSG